MMPAWMSGPAAARYWPFAIFIALLAVEPWLAGQVADLFDPRWLYGLRTALTAGVLLLFWTRLPELAAQRLPAMAQCATALAIGLGVLVLWVTLDSGFWLLGQSGSGFVPLRGDGALDWPLVLMRLGGSALVVPVMEELFWRSLLLRWLHDADFSRLDPGHVGWLAWLLSSLVFGLEHSQWAAGILAGLAYGWLYRRSRNLWLAVIAHAMTNAGLGLWVIARGDWKFW